MAEYQVVIVSPQGETWDVTERVSTLTWSGSIKRVSRSVEAVMATPNDGSLPELPCELGNELRLWAGARTRFRGNIVTREKATSTLGMEASYSVLHTKVTGKNWRVKPSNSGSTRVRVISRARSGRKLKKITLSLSEMVPSASQTTGSTNSSVTPRS